VTPSGSGDSRTYCWSVISDGEITLTEAQVRDEQGFPPDHECTEDDWQWALTHEIARRGGPPQDIDCGALIRRVR
jgi:hypothetical protein